MRDRVLTLLVGIYFGLVLVKSQVVSWYQIREMFLFNDPYMYLVITSAIAVGLVSVFLIRRLQPHTISGEVIEIKQKPLHRGMVIGGTLFGMGWAITGTCPGPIYAQIGSGSPVTLVTFLGALTGIYLYAYLYPRLPHTWFGRLRTSPVSPG